jgi:hypothetical protein
MTEVLKFSQMRRQDMENIAVFADGPAGDRGAFFPEMVLDLLVGERSGFIFRVDQFLDLFLNAS